MNNLYLVVDISETNNKNIGLTLEMIKQIRKLGFVHSVNIGSNWKEKEKNKILNGLGELELWHKKKNWDLVEIEQDKNKMDLIRFKNAHNYDRFGLINKSGEVLPAVIAVLTGANILMQSFTLDKNLGELAHRNAWDFNDFIAFYKYLYDINKMIGGEV